MDSALSPSTAPGRQLAWLMSLKAEPSAAEIQDHLEPTADVEIHIELLDRETGSLALAAGLFAFGTMIRDLPWVVSSSENGLLCLELEQAGRILCGMVAVDDGGSGKIRLLGLRKRAEDEAELDGIRLLYDRSAETYVQLGSDQAQYWIRAREWLQNVTRDGDTILDVGCGPGHLTADLAPSVRVIGCDISPEMVRLAAFARPAGTFVVHDYHQPFPTQWPLVDVTVALGCLEFCSDLTQVFRNVAAATKPKGRFLVTVPRAESLTTRREITIQALPFTEITMRLREDSEVEAALDSAGLEVITHETGPGFTSPDIGAVEYGYWELSPAGMNQATLRPSIIHRRSGRPGF